MTINPMDWLTLLGWVLAMAFGAGIAWGVIRANVAGNRERFDRLEREVNRLEHRLDHLYNGRKPNGDHPPS